MEIIKTPKDQRTQRIGENQAPSAAVENEDYIVSGATMARSGGVLATSDVSTTKAMRLANEANGGPYLVLPRY